MNKIFEITWCNGDTSICEGTDVFKAIENHFNAFYLQFYLKHKEIPYTAFKPS